jgi:PTH1 family peptidyl-tRNA hydrolase
MEAEKKLIVGLGNPGIKYAGTRHNIGFMVLDEISKRLGFSFAKSKFSGEAASEKLFGKNVFFLKPMTFMNDSGESIRALAEYYGVENEDIFVVYDDAALDFGKLRIRGSGSSAGHNGMKSIIENLGGQNFPRLKIGIGKNENIPMLSYVTGKFTPEEYENFPP